MPFRMQVRFESRFTGRIYRSDRYGRRTLRFSEFIEMEIPQHGLHTEGLVDFENQGKLQYRSPVLRLTRGGLEITRPSLDPSCPVREGPLIRLSALSERWLTAIAHPDKRGSITCFGDEIGEVRWPEADHEGIYANELARFTLSLNVGPDRSYLELHAIIGSAGIGGGIPGCVGSELHASCGAPTAKFREALTKFWDESAFPQHLLPR